MNWDRQCIKMGNVLNRQETGASGSGPRRWLRIIKAYIKIGNVLGRQETGAIGSEPSLNMYWNSAKSQCVSCCTLKIYFDTFHHTHVSLAQLGLLMSVS